MKIKKREDLPDHIKAIWDELEPDMYARIGPAGMEAFCAQVYRMRDAQARITEEGLVVQDAKGNPVPHPAIAIEKQAQAEVRTWTDKFGGCL